jgi:hypothetical protein
LFCFDKTKLTKNSQEKEIFLFQQKEVAGAFSVQSTEIKRQKVENGKNKNKNKNNVSSLEIFFSLFVGGCVFL